MKRDAWEMLPVDGIFFQWIRPKGVEPYAIAMTVSELHDVFGEVRESESWNDARCYHFPKVPPATAAFRVHMPGARSVRSEATAPVRRSPRIPPPKRSDIPASDVGPTWLKSYDVNTRRVMHHLSAHGVITEAEATGMLGGASSFRRFSRNLERHAKMAPFGLRVEPSPSGKRIYRTQD